MQQILPEVPYYPARPVPALPALESARTAQPHHQLPAAAVRQLGQEELRTRIQEGARAAQKSHYVI